ncbi:MAG: glycosyltransferase family 2 protein [Thermoprotei archaeon]|nr:MAG: glycosyltransferase family 2 protein [Thermoprotei archaeon]
MRLGEKMYGLIAMILIAIHFGIPLAYYVHATKKWLSKPWKIGVKRDYRPKITIIIPTYNEAKTIERKLNNIYEQDYPKDKLEIIVIDSASTDGTPQLVEKWAKERKDITLKLVEEPVRRGKAQALNKALKYAVGQIVIITDADSLWPSRDTISKVVSVFSDPIIGAVSCIKEPNIVDKSVEASYRRYYNVLRIAESKVWSTPIFHGELAAFRRDLLEELGGFPTDIGADDSHAAHKVSMLRYRAIILDDVKIKELVPRGWRSYIKWRIRRAQHLVQHFIRAIKDVGNAPDGYKAVLFMESYLHLINPWLLPIALLILALGALSSETLAVTLMLIGVLSLAYRPYRTWILSQIILMIAMLRNIWSKELIWEKQIK